MKETPRELTDAELTEVVKLIGAPTFKYLMKRIQNNILLDKKYSDISINSFISAIVIALSSLDANTLTWVSKFYKLKIGKDIDFDKLTSTLKKNIHEQLGITLN
jgi:hypothetical protein